MLISLDMITCRRSYVGRPHSGAKKHLSPCNVKTTVRQPLPEASVGIERRKQRIQPRIDTAAMKTITWPGRCNRPFIRMPGRALLIMLLLPVAHVHTSEALAGVSLYDQLATPSRPFYLKLRTHRGPLAMGGVRGTFWIDGQQIGTVLTGADGYGFLKYQAPATGTFSLAVRTAAGNAEARLRIITPSTSVVFFESEALLWHMLRTDRKAVAAGVLAQIASKFELIYLCGAMGRRAARELIRERGLPDRIVLVGKNRLQFEQLANRGVLIFAVVGSARFVAAARGLSRRAFSFETSAHARRVTHWEDLRDQLNEKGDGP